MSKFFIQFSREVAAYFRSPLAYVVLFCYLLLTGFNFHFGLSALNMSVSRIPVVEAFFNNVLFWFPFVLVFPLLTMRLFAEEVKMGTIETLMTAPVRDGQIVLAKFCAALVFYIVLWLPSLLYFLIFQWQTRLSAAAAAGPYLGAYFLLLLLGLFYLSVGCLASALSRNQIVAAMISFAAITLLFFLGLVSYLLPNVSPQLRELTSYFSAIDHMVQFSRGVFDTRPIVWYLSMTAFFLYLTLQVFQSRKWRGA
jgi:ABC-2 type transport system permease protein